ncbi:MAG: alpha/beta hydrolase [Alphaproteobacteria bacterium]|nr:alpha/beta hydrolase [Rickettsiales bacterium]
MSEVCFNGPIGRIEGRYSKRFDKSAPVALILHPDPMQGGTMNNKCTYTLFKIFAETGFTVLRINFPGVGNSDGVKGNGENEFRVASCALDWLQCENPNASHYWISGFSFGSFVAMQLATRRPEIENFVLLAPPANKYDYSFSVPCPLPGLVLSAVNDKIATLSSIKSLVEDWSKKKDCKVDHHVVPDADHFFNNKLDDVESAVKEYVNVCLAMRISKPVRKKRRKRKKKDREYEDNSD